MKKDFQQYRTLLLALSLAMLLSLAPAPSPASLETVVWPEIEFSPYISGVDKPVHITHAGDGSGRLFVVEQPGRIRLVKGDSLLPTPFLDISARVLFGGEQGLLSVAFPPDYPEKGHFYVYYTNKSGDNQVSRFDLTGNPDLADPASEKLILYLNHPARDNHNGGQISFGPDGYLYIATGDGGGGGDPDQNAQDPASLLGKILRIAVEYYSPEPSNAPNRVHLPLIYGSSDPHPAYRIPADNPFVGTPGYRGEIWALGLRNPWRFSFDRLNGDLYIGDVGQGKYEEVDYQPASSAGGENYGWNIMEGPECYVGDTCDQTGLTLPVAYYGHGPECSITGGYVYRGQANPSMQGFYFYGDYCSGGVFALIQDAGQWQSDYLVSSTAYSITSFGEDESGELYLADLGGGVIYRINEAAP